MPTSTPTLTPTPTPTINRPQPGELLIDGPYCQSITDVMPGDFLQPIRDSSIIINDTILVDIYQSDMGSSWAYPGDTIGLSLLIKNNGPAIDTIARAKINISMILYGDGIPITVPLAHKEYDTRLAIGDHSTTRKNISYTVPTDIPPSLRDKIYQVEIMYYINDQPMSGAIKEVNIL
jgi:hypothetical protein